MRCAEPSFSVVKPLAVDGAGIPFAFCAGKATWFPEIVRVFGDCRTALETGILPLEGSLAEQDDLFVEVFPIFVERWRERVYARVWDDVRVFTKSVLEAVFGKGGRSGPPRR